MSDADSRSESETVAEIGVREAQETGHKNGTDISSRGLMSRIMGLLRTGNGTARSAHSESVAAVLREHGDSEEPLREEERVMLLNLLRFRNHRVDDVMVPRADIIAVDVESSVLDLIRIFNEAGHSRLPVYRDTLDDPLGMVHIKDVLACFTPVPPREGCSEEDGSSSENADTGMICLETQLSLSKLKRDVLFVPPSMPAVDLLLQMQTQRIHMALVIDEYGGTDGLVTIEDLVEMIVGDIEDEHDVEEDPECTMLPGGSYLADARMEIDDFRELSGLDLHLADDEEDEVDTLGGLVFTLLGRVPRRGEIIRHPDGVDLEIVEADPRRIRKLKVMPQGKKREAGHGGSARTV